MRCTSIFPCIMTMISNFKIFFIFQIFIFKFFFTNRIDFWIFIWFMLLFFFLILTIFIVCSFNNSQNLFVQSLPVFTLHLFSMLLNEDLVGIEKPEKISSLTFVIDELSELFLHLSIFSIIHSRSAKIMNSALSDFWYWLNYNILVSSESIKIIKRKFLHTFLCIQVCFLLQKKESNSNNKNRHDVYKLFLLIMLRDFLLQDNAIFVI